ncbi:MAG TPA: hypothetical protein VIK30_01245, partial [Polyangia bacterium]
AGNGGTAGVTGSGGTTGDAGTGGTAGVTGGGTAGVTGSGGTTGVAGSGGTTGTAGRGGATGTAGRGGATGTGGTTGVGGRGGATGAGGGAVAPFFTDDFESDTMGQQPAGFDNFISYNYKTTNPQGDGTGAVVDATHTHNGSKFAVHFKASGGNPVFLERALPTGTNHLYLRVWVFLMNAMGDLPMSGGDNHETLLGLTGDPSNDNTQVRFGQIKGVIGTNQVPTDNIAPIMAQWYGGPVISSGVYHCIQVEFDGSATYNSLRAYSDGTLIHSITAAADWQNGALPATWMSGMFVDVLLGWQSFSSMANDVWMDDLVLSTGPTSCN